MGTPLLELPTLAERLPSAPDPSLDPVLDAAVDCLARPGISKTTLSDIASEMGMAPSTVYRKVGAVDNVALLVFAREPSAFWTACRRSWPRRPAPKRSRR